LYRLVIKWKASKDKPYLFKLDYRAKIFCVTSYAYKLVNVLVNDLSIVFL